MKELAHKSHLKEIERMVEHLLEDWLGSEFSDMDRYFSNHEVMIETVTHRRIMGVDEVVGIGEVD